MQQLFGSEAVEPLVLEVLAPEVPMVPAAEGRLMPPTSAEVEASLSLALVVVTLPLAIILSQQMLPNLELSSILESSTLGLLFFMPSLL